MKRGVRRIRRARAMKDLVLLGASTRESLLKETAFADPKGMLERAARHFADDDARRISEMKRVS